MLMVARFISEHEGWELVRRYARLVSRSSKYGVRKFSSTLGSLLWLLCFQYFVAEQIAMHAWGIPYSMARNYISDLGAVHCVLTGADPVCSPLHGLMNSSFVLQGLLIFFGTFLIRRLFPGGRILTVALFLIALSGIGISIVGFAPEDANPTLHYAAAAEHFLLDNLGMALLGLALICSSSRSRVFCWFTLTSGLVGLAATLLLSRRIFLGCGVGGMERVAAYPFPFWLTLAGLFLLLRQNAITAVQGQG